MAHALCASACGWIWLAGTTRYVSLAAQIGFHAVYTGTSGDVSSAGNALVGAYLIKLGLSYQAIAFVTSAPPDSIRWIHPADAERIGIQYVALADPVSQQQMAKLPDISPAQAAASTTVAYANGRQDRIEYERWFASIPDGAYRNGAVFWASNRSLKPSPSCFQPGTSNDWLAGCAASRARLATVDIRRKSESNYWWGWNSL
jgi:hypothetical protein